jgi:hypothetical protein
VHPGVGAVHDVREAAVVDFDVVGLDRCLAAFLAVHLDAPLIGVLGDLRDVVARLLGPEWVADVHSPDAGVEPGDEHDLPIPDRGHVLVRGVRAEAAAFEQKSPVRSSTL